MPINEQDFESVKRSLDTLMKEFLPKFIGKLNAVAANTDNCNQQIGALTNELELLKQKLEAQPVQPAEKPKRKRRSKAEIEAAKAEAEQTAIDTAVDAAVAAADDPSDEVVTEIPDAALQGRETPVEVAGIGITSKTVQSVMMLYRHSNEDTNATIALAEQYKCPGDVVRYVLGLSDEERADIIQRFDF